MTKKAQIYGSQASETLITLLLPIGKLMLKDGFGISDLIRAAKQAYIRAAISQEDASGKRVNASRLSVMTGLTRKEISSIVGRPNGAKSIRQSEVKEQRALRVLRGWTIDPRFTNGRGEPCRLCLRGDRRSFSELVRLYGNDVTPNSVLKELQRMKIVALESSGELRLRAVRTHSKSAQHMTDLARLLPDFARTVGHQSSSTQRPAFFGFRDSFVDSPDQAARFQRTFSSRAAAVLQGMEQWITTQNRLRRNKSGVTDKKCRVGIGIYLVQDNCAPSKEHADTVFGAERRTARMVGRR